MDWTLAYNNSAAIAGSDGYPDRWAAEAAAFRSRWPAMQTLRYGPGERMAVDLFRPEDRPRGLAVFIHGGFWMRFGRSDWSHLAEGALTRGWAVAMVGYDLCPAVTVGEITRQAATAIETAAAEIDGPIALAGHSAGGHLVTRMLCTDTPLGMQVQGRIQRCLSISGVHDLRPLRLTPLNETLHLDAAMAAAESPALAVPRGGVPIRCVVGADELPEFRRQTALLGLIWGGLGVDITYVEAEGHHHFSIVEALVDADSALVSEWLT